MSHNDFNDGNEEMNSSLLNDKKDTRTIEIDVDKKTYKTNNSSGTFRKKGENANDWHPEITSNNFAIEKKHNDGELSNSIMLPVSEFELFFPDFLNSMITKRLSFHNNNLISNQFNFDVPNLKNGLDPIREFLEEKSIKKSIIESKKFYHTHIKEIYELPVIGVEICNKINNHENKSIIETFYKNYNSLYNFQGKYDPTVLYILTGINSFIPGIRYIFADIPNNVVEINYTAHNKYNRKNISIPRPTNDSFNRNLSEQIFASQEFFSFNTDDIKQKKNKHSSKYIILKIDPNDNIKIKYISVMGRPYSTKRYPEYKKERDEKNHTNKHFQHRVIIMDEKISNTNFVKRIEVHGKIKGGKWIFIGTYDCNFDRVTEKLIDLQIPDNFDPTYLKIIPISYDGIPSLRLSMYGVPKENNIKSNACQNSDTITYCLEYHEDVFYSYDGIQFYGSPDWYYADVIRKHEDYDNLRIDLNQYTKKYNNNIADDNYDDIGYSRTMLKEIDQYGSLFALDDVQ